MLTTNNFIDVYIDSNVRCEDDDNWLGEGRVHDEHRFFFFYFKLDKCLTSY